MSKLTKNIIYNLLGQLFIMIFGFVAVKFIFKQLGEDALGIIYFALMMNGLLCVVLETGVCFVSVREISASIDSEPQYIKYLVRTFSSFFWVVYVLLVTLIYLIAPVIIEKWIHLKTMDTATAVYVLRILGISSLLALPKSFYASLLRGLQRMEFNNLIDVFISGTQQLGTIYILILKGSLFQVIYWIAGCYGLSILIYLVFSIRFFSLGAIIPGYSFDVVKRNLKFTSRMMFISTIAAIHTQADKIIVSKLLPIGLLGYYGFAYTSASKGSLLTGAISQAVFPSFSAQFKAGDHSGLISQYRKLQDFLCFAVVPIFAAIPFALLPLFSYIFNVNIARLLLLPTTLLCVGFYMNGTLTVPGVFLLAVGKPGIIARMNFYALFVVLPVTVLLIYFFGLIGAGFSWVFYHIFAYSYAVPKFSSECLKSSVWKWYLHVVRIFVLVSLTYGLAWIIIGLIGNRSVFSLAIAYAGASVVYLAVSYFMIGDELKETFFRLSKGLKMRIIEFA